MRLFISDLVESLKSSILVISRAALQQKFTNEIFI